MMSDEEFWDHAFFLTYKEALTWNPESSSKSDERPESYRPRWAALYADSALEQRRKFQEKESAREESGYRKAPPKKGATG